MKTAEITYLQANKQKTRYRLTYLELSKLEQKYGPCFVRQRLMERFQPVKTNNKVCLVYIQCKLQQDSCGYCSYKLKCLKTEEIRYFQANKQQTRYRLTYLEVWKLEQRYGWCFEGQSKTPKFNGTFSALKNKQ